MSTGFWKRRSDDEVARDAELASALEALVDPASRDPNYWLRFRAWVLERAAGELARRRRVAEITVADVLTSWSRTVVPTALLAAAVAALLLVRGPQAPTPAPTPLGVEELLVAGLEDGAFPATLTSGDGASAVVFTAEGF